MALVVSAVYDPRIRVLHALQALSHLAVIALTRRGSAWGFGAGLVMAAFWNYIEHGTLRLIAERLDSRSTRSPLNHLAEQSDNPRRFALGRESLSRDTIHSITECYDSHHRDQWQLAARLL